MWVLFSDAARLPLQRAAPGRGPLRAAARIGLPLTVLFGWALAAWFFPGLGLWLALLVGAALAPTDAALGIPVVTNPVVPSRIRQLITVESGLNDGIATPVVMVAIAGAAAAAGLESPEGPGSAAVELLIGVSAGAQRGARAGGCCGWPAGAAGRRGLRRHRRPGPEPALLRRRTRRGRQRLRRRVLRRAGVRHLRRGTGPGRTGLRRADGRPGLPARVAGLRSHHRADHAGARRPPHRATPCSASRWCACCRWRWPRLAPASTGTPSCSWAGSARAAWPPSCSRCWRWKPSDQSPTRPWRSSRATVLLSVLAHGFSAAPLAARYGRAAAAAGPEPGGPVDVVALRPGAAARRG